MPSHNNGGMATIEDVRYRIGSVATLGVGPEDTLVKEMLAAVVSRSEPIMKQRGWPVVRLAEFYPRSEGLQGMNTNHGELIQLRCRSHRNKASLLPYAHVMAVMLHELCHCAIGPHNAKFWALYKELVTQYESSEVSPLEVAILKKLGQGGELAAVRGGKAPRRDGGTGASPLPPVAAPFPGAGRTLNGTKATKGVLEGGGGPMVGAPRYASTSSIPPTAPPPRISKSKLIPPKDTSSSSLSRPSPSEAAAYAAMRRYHMWREAVTIYNLVEDSEGEVHQSSEGAGGACGGACGGDCEDDDEVEIVGIVPAPTATAQPTGTKEFIDVDEC